METYYIRKIKNIVCSPAWAEFIGWQKDPEGEPIPLFNIRGEHPNAGSTVDANHLYRLGVMVPTITAKKESKPWKQKYLK